VDLKKDLLLIRYDPSRVTPDQMLQAINKVGYEGIVMGDKDAPP
jgi:hypothetical protein